MKLCLFIVAVLLTVPACTGFVSNETPTEPENPAVTSTLKTKVDQPIKPIDFARLLQELNNCNEKELAYFDQHWDDIHAKLKQSAASGALAELPIDQQEELWTALVYLQGCRNGRIMHEHGRDMLAILFKFGTPKQLDSLRAAYPNGP